MKKFYDKHLRVNDDELISNSTFVANIVFSMFVMVICVAMMSMSAFAYFSYSLSSSHNTIVSASYSLSVVNKQGTPEKEHGVFVLDNSLNTGVAEYTFELVKPSSATASSGFGEVIIYKGEEVVSRVYTNPINKTDKPLYYKIIVPANENYTVKFIAHWGTCSSSDVGSNDIIKNITKDEYVASLSTIEVILEEEVDENLDEELLEGEEGTEEEEPTDDETVGDDSSNTGSDEIIDDESNNQEDSNDESMDDNQDDLDKDDTVLDDETGSDDEILDDGNDEKLNNSDEQSNEEVEDAQEQEEPVDNTIEQQDVENKEEESGEVE